MKNRIWLFLMLMLTAGIAQAELKIGFVNVAKVLEKAPQAAKAKSRLETEFSPRDKALVSQQKEIKSMEEKLTRDAEVIGDEERRRLEKDIIDKKRDAARAQQEFSEDFNMRRNEELGNLQKRIVEAVRALAKEESFDLLLTDGVIYADDAIDVTSRVQQKLETLSQ
ncbi:MULTISPECIES: OmpH family outer membrane protein [Methylomonas]|uniref:OmpH family outer membrane protein n=1 Tax=Methylomonas TaxID=416 RepID=UPI0012329894|nr:OmpH family outer membrane protein [Methylomonas rhizoryzae]